MQPTGDRYISMGEEEDWLFRPVMRGLLRAESLYDCTADLQRVAILNEAIDVEQENAYRAAKYENARRNSKTKRG